MSSSGARLMSPRFNPLKKPLMTMRPAAMRKNHQGVDIAMAWWQLARDNVLK